MAVITIKELLEAGAHLGHRTNRWNPKMKRYIFEERNGIYIIDLKQTLRQVEQAWQFARDCVAEGNEIIFVGTKKQARKIVAEVAQDCGMPWISERWLGGTLTNFTTIRKSVKRLNELDQMERDGILKKLSKKEASALRREAAKLHRNLDGIKDMDRLPSAMVVIDVDRERIAVLEALKVGIPIIAIIDTNIDPDKITYPIAGNDDAMRNIRLILEKLTSAVKEGKVHRRPVEKVVREPRTPAPEKKQVKAAAADAKTAKDDKPQKKAAGKTEVKASDKPKTEEKAEKKAEKIDKKTAEKPTKETKKKAAEKDSKEKVDKKAAPKADKEEKKAKPATASKKKDEGEAAPAKKTKKKTDQPDK